MRGIARERAGAAASRTARGQACLRARTGAAAREERHEHKEHDNGEVLKEKDGEGGAAVARARLGALLHDLHDHRRGGQRERAADDDGGGAGVAGEQDGGAGDCTRGQRELQRAEHKDLPRERDEALQRQLQAEVEEEKDDANLGQVLHGLRVHDEAHTKGADDRARNQEAENGAAARHELEHHRDRLREAGASFS